MKMFKKSVPMLLSLTLLACSSSDNEAVTPDVVADTPAPDTMKPGTMKADDKDDVIVIPDDKDKVIPVLTLSFTPTKTFRFTWAEVPGATSYNIKEAITVASGFDTTPIFETTNATVTTRSFDHIVPLHGRVNAKYMLQSCNADGCAESVEVHTSTRLGDMASSIGYFKASNTDAGDQFGTSVSISADGSTLAVSAPYEDSNSTMINMSEDDDTAGEAGAVYVFTLGDTGWSQQAYLKARNAGGKAARLFDDGGDVFGISVSLSGDGNTLAVGATGEDSNDAAVETNDSAKGVGAAYVFIRDDTGWSQQAYLKASNAGSGDRFGGSVSLSTDGNTLAVGAREEQSAQKGVNPTEVANDNTLPTAGAVYVFARSVMDNTMWSEEAYIKASNTEGSDAFGKAVSLSADGNTLAVGAIGESSIAIGINPDETTNGEPINGAQGAGAVYVFFRTDTTTTDGEIKWTKQAYLKASNTGAGDIFGSSVSLSTDGNILAVGAPNEDSMATGVNNLALQGDNGAEDSGAVYVFTRATTTPPVWSQQAYIKASNNSNAGTFDEFGWSVSISADGKTLAVSAKNEGSDAVGTHKEDQTNSGSGGSGAVYTFTRPTTTWSQQAYIKASNTGGGDFFGYSLDLSADGGILAVAAQNEDGNAKDVNEDKDNDSAENAGAVYVY